MRSVRGPGALGAERSPAKLILNRCFLRRVVGHEAALHRGDENVARAGVILPAVLRGLRRSKTPQLPLMARPRRVVWRSARRTEGCCSGASTGREHEEQDVPSSRAARPAGGSDGRSLPGLCRNRLCDRLNADAPRHERPAAGDFVDGGNHLEAAGSPSARSSSASSSNARRCSCVSESSVSSSSRAYVAPASSRREAAGTGGGTEAMVEVWARGAPHRKPGGTPDLAREEPLGDGERAIVHTLPSVTLL
jgi:hypothetical protein